MIHEDEIRLLGHPIKIVLPGNAEKKYKSTYYNSKDVQLNAGETYYGFCVDEDRECPSLRNIYITINNRIVSLSDYHVDNMHPISKYVTFLQREFYLEDLYKILRMFNKKLDDLQEQLYDKADRD